MYIYIYVCVCACVYAYMYTYISINEGLPCCLFARKCWLYPHEMYIHDPGKNPLFPSFIQLDFCTIHLVHPPFRWLPCVKKTIVAFWEEKYTLYRWFSQKKTSISGGPLWFSMIFPWFSTIFPMMFDDFPIKKLHFYHGDVHFKASQNDLLSQGQRRVPGTLLQKCVVASRLPYGDVEMRKYL